jgi:hypothetical protein
MVQRYYEEVKLKTMPTEEEIRKGMRESIMRPVPGDDQDTIYKNKMERFRQIHVWAKNKLAYPLLKQFEKILGRFLIKSIDDIPEKWFNNHMRMMYYSWDQGLEDMWMLQHRAMNPRKAIEYGTPENYMEKYIKHKYGPGNKYRKMIFQIWLTEALEDSIDREWFNMFTMRLTHEMMKHYGVSKEEMDKVPKVGKYPIYKSGIEYNPQYFIENRDMKVWKKPDGRGYEIK